MRNLSFTNHNDAWTAANQNNTTGSPSHRNTAATATSPTGKRYYDASGSPSYLVSSPPKPPVSNKYMPTTSPREKMRQLERSFESSQKRQQLMLSSSGASQREMALASLAVSNILQRSSSFSSSSPRITSSSLSPKNRRGDTKAYHKAGGYGYGSSPVSSSHRRTSSPSVSSLDGQQQRLPPPSPVAQQQHRRYDCASSRGGGNSASSSLFSQRLQQHIRNTDIATIHPPSPMPGSSSFSGNRSYNSSVASRDDDNDSDAGDNDNNTSKMRNVAGLSQREYIRHRTRRSSDEERESSNEGVVTTHYTKVKVIEDKSIIDGTRNNSTHSMPDERTVSATEFPSSLQRDEDKYASHSADKVDASSTFASVSDASSIPTTSATTTRMEDNNSVRSLPSLRYQLSSGNVVQPNTNRSSIVGSTTTTDLMNNISSSPSSSGSMSPANVSASGAGDSDSDDNRNRDQLQERRNVNSEWVNDSGLHNDRSTTDPPETQPPLRQEAILCSSSTNLNSAGNSVAMAYSEDSSMVASSMVSPSSSHQHPQLEHVEYNHEPDDMYLPSSLRTSIKQQQQRQQVVNDVNSNHNALSFGIRTENSFSDDEKQSSSSSSPAQAILHAAAADPGHSPTEEYWSSYLAGGQDEETAATPTSTLSVTSSVGSSSRFQELVKSDTPEKHPYVDITDDEIDEDDILDHDPASCLQFDHTSNPTTVSSPADGSKVLQEEIEFETRTSETYQINHAGQIRQIKQSPVDTKSYRHSSKKTDDSTEAKTKDEVSFLAEESEIAGINEERTRNMLLRNHDKEGYDRLLSQSAQERLDPHLLPPPSPQPPRLSSTKIPTPKASQPEVVPVSTQHESSLPIQLQESSESSPSTTNLRQKLPNLLLRLPNTAFGICFCLAGHSYMWKMLQKQHDENDGAKTLAGIFFYSGFVTFILLVLVYSIKLIRNPGWVCTELQHRGHFMLLPHLTLIWLALTKGMMMMEDNDDKEDDTIVDDNGNDNSRNVLGTWAIVTLLMQLLLALLLQQPLSKTAAIKFTATRKKRIQLHEEMEEPKSQFCWTSLGWCLCSLLSQYASLGTFPISFSLGIGAFTYVGFGLLETFSSPSTVISTSRRIARRRLQAIRNIIQQQTYPLSTLVAVVPPSLAAMVIDNYYSHEPGNNEDGIVEEDANMVEFEERSSSVVAQALLGWALWLLLCSVLRVGTRFATEQEESLGIHWSYLISFVSVACAALQVATDTATDIIAILLVALASFALLVVLFRTIYHSVLCWRHQAEWNDPLFFLREKAEGDDKGSLDSAARKQKGEDGVDPADVEAHEEVESGRV